MNIIVFGRSLGTAPATYLASERKLTGLVLISPMMSIREVVKDILGKFVSHTINDRFKNIEMIDKVECPVLIIHGQHDMLIRYYHASELYNKTKSQCELILPENMDHNEFDFFQEFSEPLLDFISRNGIFAETEQTNKKMPDDLTVTPEAFKRTPTQWNVLTKILKKLSLG